MLWRMREPPRRHRSTSAETAGVERAAYLAGRIGTAVREARRALGLRQRDVAERAGMTQSHVSRIERGLEPGTPLSTYCALAAALDVQLAAFIEARPGASLPRDLEHLTRQQVLITTSGPGGWDGEPEVRVEIEGGQVRSIDVLLTRPTRRECAVTEIWDLMPDVGDAMRGLEAKIAAMRTRLGPEWHVSGLLVIRATKRNRELVRRFGALFRARYPASSAAWLRALANRDAAMPDEAGFLWSAVSGGDLRTARLG